MWRSVQLMLLFLSAEIPLEAQEASLYLLAGPSLDYELGVGTTLNNNYYNVYEGKARSYSYGLSTIVYPLSGHVQRIANIGIHGRYMINHRSFISERSGEHAMHGGGNYTSNSSYRQENRELAVGLRVRHNWQGFSFSFGVDYLRHQIGAGQYESYSYNSYPAIDQESSITQRTTFVGAISHGITLVPGITYKVWQGIEFGLELPFGFFKLTRDGNTATYYQDYNRYGTDKKILQNESLQLTRSSNWTMNKAYPLLKIGYRFTRKFKPC